MKERDPSLPTPFPFSAVFEHSCQQQKWASLILGFQFHEVKMPLLGIRMKGHKSSWPIRFIRKMPLAWFRGIVTLDDRFRGVLVNHYCSS